MHLLLSLFLSTLVHLGFLFGVAKVLTRDPKLHKTETLYMILASLLTSVVRIFVLGVHLPNLSAHVFDDMMFTTFLLLYIPVVFLYFFKARAYSRRKAAILTAIMMSIVFLSDSIIDLAFVLFLPGVRLCSNMTPLQYPVQVMLHLFLHHALAIAFAVLLVKSTRKLQDRLKKSHRIQTIFLYICAAILAAISIGQLLVYSTEHVMFREGLPWSDAFVFALMYLLLVASFIHTRQIETRSKQEELQNLKHHTEELEQQQIAMRKFKQDHQNILMSMHAYIQDEDWAGLKQYYSSKVEMTSATITKNIFALDGLGKIKLPEIKSILAGKLMMAQNTHMDIHTTFEASEEIDHIAIDSIALVRMLGIILDNAIEALTELGGGKLFVGCYKWEAGITFIVKNTCCPDMPPLQQLRKPGFSTKGEQRGLGLFNLSELVDAYPNVSLKTGVNEGTFSQELLIEEGRENA